MLLQSWEVLVVVAQVRPVIMPHQAAAAALAVVPVVVVRVRMSTFVPR